MSILKKITALFSKKERCQNADKDEQMKIQSLTREVKLKNYFETDVNDFFLSLDVANIHWVQINDTVLSSLPVAVGRLTQLTELDLSRNKLSHLPHEIENLQKLEILNLSNNKFTRFPIVVTTISALKSLDFCNNHLKVLPTALLKLKLLATLSLEGNKINSPLPESEMQPIQVIFDALRVRDKDDNHQRHDAWASWKPFYNEMPSGGIKRLADLCTDCILYNEIDYQSGIHVPPVVKTYLSEEEHCTMSSSNLPNLLKCSVCKKYFTTKYNFIRHVCH